MADYSRTAGDLEESSNLNASGLQWESIADYRLVIGIHPRCVCSQASMLELRRILTDTERPLDCLVLVYQPANCTPDFANTTLVRDLSRLTRTEVRTDVGGEFARRLGMHTSGSVALYNREGLPVFVGGITDGRGQQGTSVGGTAIIQIVEGHSAGPASTPVFGCPIESENRHRADDHTLHAGSTRL